MYKENLCYTQTTDRTQITAFFIYIHNMSRFRSIEFHQVNASKTRLTRQFKVKLYTFCLKNNGKHFKETAQIGMISVCGLKFATT